MLCFPGLWKPSDSGKLANKAAACNDVEYSELVHSHGPGHGHLHTKVRMDLDIFRIYYFSEFGGRGRGGVGAVLVRRMLAQDETDITIDEDEW